MKKSTIILIGIIYIAAIVFISVFGLNAKVYNEVIPVLSVECVNQSDENTIVKDYNGKKLIRVHYTEPGNAETLEGTMVQLLYRVLPDNASNKRVKYIYNTDLTRIHFVKDEKGNDLGLVLFTGTGIFNVRIMAVDGSQRHTDVVIDVYP